MNGIAVLLGVCLDALLSEPRRWHPLVGFGYVASAMEMRLNLQKNTLFNHLIGVFSVMVLVLPFPILIGLLINGLDGSQASSIDFDWLVLIINALVVYCVIGHQSLKEHILPIADALATGDRNLARELTSRVVSRDPAAMNIEVSAVESALENGSDAIFSAIFWMAVAGAPGAILYRLVNTLDAMWGYKTDRFYAFGWCAARLDDLLNYIPARLAALSYVLLAEHPNRAWRCWVQQASEHASPNGGPVISAGAGALGVIVGGPTCYHGHWMSKAAMGEGRAPDENDIRRALQLVTKTTWLWVGVLVVIELVAASVLNTSQLGLL